MATKSFTTDFKFNSKSGKKLITAIESSKKVHHDIKRRVSNVSNKNEIDSIMKSFLGDN